MGKEESVKDTLEFYCVKCRQKKSVPVAEIWRERTVKGRPYYMAYCPTCNIKMTRFAKGNTF